MVVSLIQSHYRRDGRAKKRYNTLGKAENAIADVKNRWGHDMRLYHCDLCQGYHLSRINKRDPYDKEPTTSGQVRDTTQASPEKTDEG